VKPLLVEPYDIDAYIIALVHNILPAVCAFQRTSLERGDMKGKLHKRILEWCVSHMPFPPLFFFEELIFITSPNDR
jgi:hypothetical protein